MRKLPFSRLVRPLSSLAISVLDGVDEQVREIALDYAPLSETGAGLRWQSSALLALQEATEAYVPCLMCL
jgi:histone H3/H4